MRQERPVTDQSESREVQEARRRVTGALECLERSERDALDELQHAVCRYVTVLRDAGVSAARTTELVTTLINSPATQDSALAMIPAVRAALVELAVGWCVSEYARLESAQRESTAIHSKADGVGEAGAAPAG
jgi:hypothetical protein